MSSLAIRPPGPAPVIKGASLAEKRAFLESGAPWPDEPPPICIETHASLVFLTRDRAWKLKKPVHLMHVDQRLLRDRAHLCREELRLNQELSGEVYRGLVPLVRQRYGRLALGGDGQVIDWVIESVRLPSDAMLDRRLLRGPDPKLEEIEALCDLLIGFYTSRPPVADAGAIFFRRLHEETRTNALHLRQMRDEIGATLDDKVLDFAAPVIEACQPEIFACVLLTAFENGLQRRLRVDGDLRAEHICLTTPPVVFDRVEFDHGVRLVDPFYELNALGLECALLGAGWIRAVLLFRLSQVQTPPTRRLLTAYGVIRCLTRARLAVDHFRDQEVREPQKWRIRAQSCLNAAARLIDDFNAK